MASVTITSRFIIGFTSLAWRLSAWKGHAPLPGTAGCTAPGLQGIRRASCGSRACLAAPCAGRSFVQSVPCYSTGLNMQMDRETGCVSSEMRVKDFVSILICGQNQTLSIVILWSSDSQRDPSTVCLPGAVSDELQESPTSRHNILEQFPQKGLLGRNLTP